MFTGRCLHLCHCDSTLLRALKSVRECDVVQFGANQLRSSALTTQGFPHLWKPKVLGLP